MNQIIIAGHLGSDPVTRFTASGQKVTSFTVAVNGRKGGADYTIWYRITVWGDRLEKMLTYLKKGSAVIISGELGKPEIWINKEGQPQVTLEITADAIRFSPFGKSDKQGQESGQSFNANTPQSSFQGSDNSFGEQSFAPSGPAYATGQGQRSAPVDEDTVPF